MEYIIYGEEIQKQIHDMLEQYHSQLEAVPITCAELGIPEDNEMFFQLNTHKVNAYYVGTYRIIEWQDICGEWISMDLEQLVGAYVD